jgi:hypothetical protein
VANRDLPFKEKVEIASRLAISARVFFDVWWCYEGPTRKGIFEKLDVFPTFFEHDSHANFVSFVAHLAALFENRSATINIESLLGEAGSQGLAGETLKELKSKLFNAKDVSKKVIILRSNLFAHRSSKLTYEEVFDLAEINRDQISELMQTSFEILEPLANHCSVQAPFINDIAVEDLKGLINEIR